MGPACSPTNPSASLDNVHYSSQARPHCTSVHPRRELECACARASPGGSGSDKARWAAGRVVQGAPGGGRRAAGRGGAAQEAEAGAELLGRARSRAEPAGRA